MAKKKKLNILSFPLHAISDADFCSLGHNMFYLTTDFWGIGWNYTQMPLPKNVTIIDARGFPLTKINWTLPIIRERYLEKYDIDLVLAPAIDSCFLALQWGYPIVHYCNFICADEYGRGWLRYLNKAHPEIPIVFVSEDNVKRSKPEKGTYLVIDRGWDSKDYLEWKGNYEEVLVVCSSIRERTYFDFLSLYEHISTRLPVMLIGRGNAEMSGNLLHSDVKKRYAEYRVLFNIEPLSGRVMFEALATGMPVVSIQRKEFEPYIKNGVNGFMSEDVDYLIASAKKLLKDRWMAERIGKEGQKIIAEHFPRSNYIKGWDALFYKTVEGKEWRK